MIFHEQIDSGAKLTLFLLLANFNAYMYHICANNTNI